MKYRDSFKICGGMYRYAKKTFLLHRADTENFLVALILSKNYSFGYCSSYKIIHAGITTYTSFIKAASVIDSVHSCR